MGFVTDLLEKADVKQLSDYLMCGSAEIEEKRKACLKRQMKADERIFKVIQDNFPDKETQERVLVEIYNYIALSEQLNLEFGICYGACLSAEKNSAV